MRNSIQLIGNVGNTPEVREFTEGKMMARFSVATNETYKNASGEVVKNTTWHNLVAWGGLAKYIGEKVSKGNEIVIEGKLTNRSYEDKEGQRRYVTEIVANEVLVIGQKD